jgi:putative transposase
MLGRTVDPLPAKHKTIKHFHRPGDLHELTFSCYQGRALLVDDAWRRLLAVAIDRAIHRWDFRLHAFVFMPNHVHLLVSTIGELARVSELLKSIKQPFSRRVKNLLEEAGSPLLDVLTVLERPGVWAFRVWQEGPGYDRNLTASPSVSASIDYIHQNPVRKKLCVRAREWKWSSARYYESSGADVDVDLPVITQIEADFLS